jgi:hypothetical protein
VIVFRNTDVDVPFFWEDGDQPAARWHGPSEGPAQYTSSTPDAAWAEFLRHQGIDDPADLAGVERAMWAIDLPDDEPGARPALPQAVLVGGAASYGACQREARRLRAGGATRLVSPSAAVSAGTPSGWRTDGGLVAGPPGAEQTIVLFGLWPDVVSWLTASPGRPAASLLPRVRFV